MKSRSFDVPNSLMDKMKQNKTYDFVNFYKSTAETSVKFVEKQKSDDGSSKKNVVSNKLHTPKRVPNKKKNKAQNDSVDISKININGDRLPHAAEGSSLDDSKVTSTPKTGKVGAELKVKSIIKNKSLIDNSLNVSNISISNKPKKRNKSVSFMLDDTEGVVIKKSKSEESIGKLDKSIGKTKKSKKKVQDEKENKGDTSNMAIDIVPIESVATTSKLNIHNNIDTAQSFSTTDSIQKKEKVERKKQNKLKKAKNVTVESESSDVIKNEGEETKIKKIKKKKRHIKSVGTDNTGAEGEPVQKSSKKDVKPDNIVQDLESLNIGDNAHTLTNLLDEMTVVDKNKKKKNKKDKERKQEKDKLLNASSTNSEGESSENKKKGKSKKQKIDKTNTDDVPVQSTNNDSEGMEEKEKVKWVKRKWNKDKKGGANVDKHLTSIIIENLPLALMFTYRKLLAEHFGKFGMIRQVGVAEMYPTAEPKPVFTTSINFYSEDAAEKALEDDNTVLEGARIRVKRPLPPTLSTLVVRSYSELTEQALSSMFSGAGRIRNMRLLVKGKKSLSTAFIEFDGPKSVERAIDMAEDARIGGKKVHVAKFEMRAANKKTKKDKTHNDNEDTDNSNE